MKIDWGRLEKNGKFVQGVKLNYGPKEFYTQDLLNNKWVDCNWSGGREEFEYSLVWRIISDEEWEKL